ncbi:TPA: RNA-guided endonuclease InsQ/TnpB family protein, partial [Providencia stuartii]
REITGMLKSITLSRSTTGKYYASLLCDDGMEAPEKPALISNVTGLDMGLTHFAIKSDGNKIANPRHLINASHNLRRKQKALSRKKKGSANRRKARIQLASVHERVANARADFQHKLSRAIVDENQAVIVETLKAANMMKNHHLARAIGDAG